MQSVRRAALRAARSSPMALALPRQQVASFAMRITKANAQPIAILPLARHFSQTARVNEEEDTFVRSDEPARQESGGAVPSGNIFVSNMTFDATEEHIRDAFAKFGEITDIKVIRDARGLSRGFCFISYSDVKEAEAAVAEADRSFWHGRRIFVEHRRSETKSPRNNTKTDRRPGTPTSSLYIGNIPYETSDADLNNLFKGLDGVTDVRVAVDRQTGWPRGFAHADFNSVEAATAAMEKLAETTIGNRSLRLDYSEPRNKVLSE